MRLLSTKVLIGFAIAIIIHILCDFSIILHDTEPLPMPTEYEAAQFWNGRNVTHTRRDGPRVLQRRVPRYTVGTVLSQRIRAIIMEYCQIQYEQPPEFYLHKQYDHWLGYMNFSSANTKQSRVHFWRDPVQTIVSAFFYHKSCNEPFISDPIETSQIQIIKRDMFNNTADWKELKQMYWNLVYTFDFDKEIPIFRPDRMSLKQKDVVDRYPDSHNHWWANATANQKLTFKIRTKQYKPSSIRYLYLYYLNHIIHSIDLLNFGDYYGFDININDTYIHRRFNIFRSDFNRLTIKGWYKQMFTGTQQEVYGIFYEMIRYLFWIFPEIHHYHFELGIEPQNELKMETWFDHFDDNINVILNELNLIDNEENRYTLEKNQLGHVDIAQEREILYHLLKTQDTTVASNKTYKRRLRSLTPHRKRRQPKNRSKHTESEQVQRHFQLIRNGTKYGRSKQQFKIQQTHVHLDRNSTKYAQQLLTLDHNICLLLKHITTLIQYPWNYHQYC
eukprot:56721_1